MKLTNSLLLIFTLGLMPAWVRADSAPNIPVSDRVHGADKMVVATVESIEPRWETNSYGDKLIVSRYRLKVEEDLKGNPQQDIDLDFEGGTLDGMTLRVSSLEPMQVGERAVFLLTIKGAAPGPKIYRPHLKGMGIFKLKADNRVENGLLGLDDFRRMAKGGVTP